MEPQQLILGLHSLVIFRSLSEETVIQALFQLLSLAESDDPAELTDAYCDFAAVLFEENDNFSLYLKNLLFEDQNVYIKSIVQKRESALLKNCLYAELEFLSQLALFDGSDIRAKIQSVIPLPAWKTEKIDFSVLYSQRIAEIPTKGFGIFSKYYVFTIGENGALVPVQNPDQSRLDDLYGYETERGKVIANTRTLLAGGHANNVLLYGDAGTGKSSTVKAIVNEYKDEGLRLIEIGKHQFYRLPDLMDYLSSNPLKFIIFIDDLCFDSDDRDFSAFKAILEGSVNSRGQNILIYATSNHRHLIKEHIGYRTGDEVNINDTLQEMSSLAARFGLTVTFERPNKMLYGEIVLYFAKKMGVDMEESALTRKAEAFAIRSGNRNARVAKQFVELIKSGIIQ